MTIEQKFDTFLQKKGNKILSKINKFKQLSLTKNWHLFCLLIRKICVRDFSLNVGFSLRNIKFGISYEGIIH
jgi:hypothetical protein